jgi:hypothetical protein
MKVLTIPSSGKIGQVVAFKSRFGMAHRMYTVPRNNSLPAQSHMRRGFGHISQTWGPGLTQPQRDLWNYAGSKVMSHPRLSSGPLTGQQLFQGLNSARFCISLPPLLVPPAPVTFGPNPVKELIPTWIDGQLRLLLRVSPETGEDASPASEYIMVFGQAPCSAGRSKRRNVSYLGLLPFPVHGLSDITDIYVAKYGEPRPGEKVFIVTVQQNSGWEGIEQETSEIIPQKPTDPPAPASSPLTLTPHMHKGCTRDVTGTNTTSVPDQPHLFAQPTGGNPASLPSSGGEGRGEQAVKTR